MAYKNKIITNPIVGQQIKFLQTAKDTGGKLLEMDASYRPYSKEPPPHYHPSQEEDFMILKGQMTGSTSVINWKIQPALNTEYFLETATGLASDKRRRRRMRSLLQRSLMANKYSGVFRLSKPPFFIQKILFLLFTPFAWLVGYRASYKQYFD